MGWISVIMFIITNVPKIISLVKQLLDLFDSKKEAKEALPTILDTVIEKKESGSIRKILSERRAARRSARV